MKSIVRIFILVFVLCWSVEIVSAQQLKKSVYKSKIHTVQLRKKGDSLAPPIIHLNSNEHVILSFDELREESHSYSYKLVHCNSQWEPSDLMEHEYLYSQFSSNIQFSKSSFNTMIPYTHYREVIPNDRIEPSISGNYAIIVYAYNNPKDTVLIEHLRISEGKASVRASMEEINRMSPSKPNQQLNFSVNTGSMYIQNPYNDLKAVVKQNGHNRQYISEEDPSSMHGDKFVYQHLDELKFKGGNEFYHFNTKSVDFAGKNIETIDFLQNMFHVRLTPDHDRSSKKYKTKQELNGAFMIDKERSSNPALEADYAYVYFSLKDATPDMTGGKVYVTGGFNNWNCSAGTEMKYNFDEKAYQKRILLKQGYYNYKYVLVNDQGGQDTFYSGNFYQTDNQYEIYLYYRDYSKGYDRLIGHTLYNSSSMDY